MENLLSLEDQFYERGYNAGREHGNLHGVFEGRELGREQGWQLWEEVGFYDGFAVFWKALLTVQKEKEGAAFKSSRPLVMLHQITELVTKMPTINDSSATSTSTDDMTDVLKTLRSKYKTVCAILGVRPRLAVANGQQNGHS